MLRINQNAVRYQGILVGEKLYIQTINTVSNDYTKQDISYVAYRESQFDSVGTNAVQYRIDNFPLKISVAYDDTKDSISRIRGDVEFGKYLVQQGLLLGWQIEVVEDWDYPGLVYRVKIPSPHAHTTYSDFITWLNNNSKPSYFKGGYFHCYTDTLSTWQTALENDDLVIIDEQ